jgi:metal-responsive CopG/Arc/MetJ family transcriptional regulator
MKLHQDKTRRTSVSFSQELYSELALPAKRKKVSMAWIIRDAAKKYIANNYPFFKDRQTKS